ncbi:MAG: citramalate synthase [Candidatus Methylarchaceae archaeon HK02M2]|nr:citramalate synthase [Candidatus Methylarchaceae archaeon HK02M2]
MEFDLDIEILDTTLRDGAQTYGVGFSLQDKLSIAQRLDELGVRYIEGGWPSSNPKDMEFFKAIKKIPLRNSEVVAFGSTRRKNLLPSEDEKLNSLLEIGVDTLVIFGKSWDLHVTDVLHTTLEENLAMVKDSIEYLKSHDINVIFDAEHFFDGFKDNYEYAVRVVKTAEKAGANVIVLCDTNGGTLTMDIQNIIEKVKVELETPLGIHCHNDSGLAIANTIISIFTGVRHIQCTINGLGERCGNTDLCQILPTLHFKMGLRALSNDKPINEQLKKLLTLSKYVYNLVNLPPNPYQPYVGKNAFAHKGGVHIDAILKQPKAYEHIDPILVGNRRELSISELSGRASIVNMAQELGLKLDKQSDIVDKVLEKIKLMEAQGYRVEDAIATLHLILLRVMGYQLDPFQVKRWKVSTMKNEINFTSGEIMVKVGDEVLHEVSVGVGPVHALDQALRKALLKCFPQLKNVKLLNYKVTVVDSGSGTASSVRTFIEFKDNDFYWATTAVSEDIINASAMALVDGYTYRLILHELKGLRI